MANFLTRLFNINIPEKVYVQKDGLQYEYSEDPPSGLMRSKFDDLISGVYSSSNFIELFYSLPEIFAPVHEIAKRVSDANWQLLKDWNDEQDWNNTFFNQLFTKPNPLMSHKDFVYQAVCYELLTGKEFFYFKKVKIFDEPYKNITSWWNLPAQQITAVHKKNFDIYSATSLQDFVVRYEQDKKVFETENVIPVCNLDLTKPEDMNASRSYLMGASKAIKNLLPVYEARGVIYIKRGALGFLVSKKSDESGYQSLTKREKQEVRDDFQSTYGVTRNKNTISVTSVPVDFVKTSMSIQELEPFEETLADAVAIYKVLRVPRHLVPSKDHSTFANADADMKSFYTDVIIPIAKRYAEIWTSYFQFERRYINADFSHISFLQKNRKEEADVDKINGGVWMERWLNSACSLNEWIADNKGEPGTGPVYEKKFLDMTPDEMALVKGILTLKIPIKNEPTTSNPEDKGAPPEGGADKL